MAFSAKGVSSPTATVSPMAAGLTSMAQQASGSLSDTSARAASDSSSLIKSVQDIAAQNTAVSAQQAEQLRKWQERQNEKAMAFNAAEAAKNRDWQKMMSDTAHQREIKDLQAAGLNPILSAMGGSGASVGSGATASGVTSSGAKGDVDQSASQGLVSLLGTLMNTQTELLSKAMSARSNEAIADKQNATSELIAHLTGDYGLMRERISGQTARDVQSMKQSHEEYMRQNYPDSWSQLAASLVNIGSKAGSGHSPAEQIQYVMSGHNVKSTNDRIDKLMQMGLTREQAAMMNSLYETKQLPGMEKAPEKGSFGSGIQSLIYKLISP